MYDAELLARKQRMFESLIERQEGECRERVAMAEKRRDDALERARLNRLVVFNGSENRINSIKQSVCNKQVKLSDSLDTSLDENKRKLAEEKATHRATKRKLEKKSTTAAARLSREKNLKEDLNELRDEYLDDKKMGN